MHEDAPEFVRTHAIHPHWRGALSFSKRNSTVVHESSGNRGRYSVEGEQVTVFWEAYDADRFVSVGDVLIHRDILAAAPELGDLSVVRAFGRQYLGSGVRLLVPEAHAEVELRLGTSDVPTFRQVFVDCEYTSASLPETAATIVDLGANIGLASLYFAARYPQARILAVEPEAENFALLLRNTAVLGGRVDCRQAAVWLHDGTVRFQTRDDDGQPLGAWGARVAADGPSGDGEVPCFRLATLLAMAEFAHVDILKVDIEGAERELFSCGLDDCLGRIGLVIVETHDRSHSGSEAAVRAALASGFQELPRNGENLFFRRLP